MKNYLRPCKCGQTNIELTGYCSPCDERSGAAVTTDRPEPKTVAFTALELAVFAAVFFLLGIGFAGWLGGV